MMKQKITGVIFTEDRAILIDVTGLELTNEFYSHNTTIEVDGVVTFQIPNAIIPNEWRLPVLSSMAHKKIIFNGRTTTVLWKDGSVTVVKAAENEPFDPEKGVAVAFMKKALGNQNLHNKILRKDIQPAIRAALKREQKRCERADKARNELIRKTDGNITKISIKKVFKEEAIDVSKFDT